MSLLIVRFVDRANVDNVAPTGEFVPEMTKALALLPDCLRLGSPAMAVDTCVFVNVKVTALGAVPTV